jgi:hypothetical protein
MADFLTRLIERAWGQAPTVQPLIPSRYAAIPTRFEAPPSHPLTQSEPSEPPQVNPPALHRFPLSAPQPLVLASPLAPNAAIRLEASVETQPVSPGVEPVAEGMPRRPLDSPPPAQVSSPDEPAPRLQPRQVVTGPEIRSLPGFRANLPQLAGLNRVAPEASSPAASPPLTPDPVARNSTPATGSRPAVDRPELPPAPIFLGQSASLSAVGLSPMSRGSSPEPPAPRINVTIGRVEIRAVFEPPAKAAPPARPEPKLSLEDYLRPSTGGRR